MSISKGGDKMLFKKVKQVLANEKGMEMVQVAILVAIAIGVGIIFKDNIGKFISDIFKDLVGSNFKDV